VALTKQLLPIFKAQKEGQIVNLISVVAMGNIGLPTRTTYAGSKAALAAFMTALRFEVGHVLVTCAEL
jgi:short-subunit dehydrogenase